MGVLDRKLLRDLWDIRGQALAISLVIGAGVSMFNMYLGTFDSLRLTQAAYYDHYRFADVFVSLKRAPLRLEDQIARIPGVRRLAGRIVVAVSLHLEGMAEPAVGRLVSIPERHTKILNDVFLRKGRYIEPGHRDEVLVSEAFSLAHGLQPGDRLAAVLNGRRRRLKIVGVALSPEYVYSIQPGELIPDSTHFGVLWMGRRALASAFDMEGAFNDLAVTLLPGTQTRDVISRIDTLLKPYGGLGAIPRALQISHWYLDSELTQLQTIGLIVPLIFLAVAAFLLNIVLSRTVTVQREQIAALKALGYSNRELAFHYIKWSLLMALGGAALGTGGGTWLGSGMTNMYNQFYRFPTLTYELPPAVVLGGVLVSLLAAVLGAFNAVRSAVRLPPAEAMRPMAPAAYRESWLERLGLKRFLSQSGRITLRNLQRRPGRAFLSIVGIASSAAMLVFGTFFIDALDTLMDVQFNVVQRQDLTITFVEPASARAFHEVQRLPGVVDAETMRSIPARLRFGHRSRQVAIVGLAAAPHLNRVIDSSLAARRLPPEGLVLSTKLAEILALGRGDEVTVEVLEGARPVRKVVVGDLVEEYLGTNAYMEAGALHRLMREGESLSGAFVQADAAHLASLYRRLKRMPAVAGVVLKRALLESFKSTLLQNLNILIFFNLLFAGIIAFGVVYNTARIALSERTRELATLRVMGFTRREISAILLSELGVLTVVAVPLGLVLGYGLAALYVSDLDTELYRIPLVITARTYALAAATVLAAGLFSGLALRYRLNRLDLIAVLKSRE
ncbi:MAG: ABC transporter permease [Acidobacteriota bacterium]